MWLLTTSPRRELQQERDFPTLNSYELLCWSKIYWATCTKANSALESLQPGSNLRSHVSLVLFVIFPAHALFCWLCIRLSMGYRPFKSFPAYIMIICWGWFFQLPFQLSCSGLSRLFCCRFFCTFLIVPSSAFPTHTAGPGLGSTHPATILDTFFTAVLLLPMFTI